MSLIWFLLALCAVPSDGGGAPDSSAMRAGDRAFANIQYAEALRAYGRGAVADAGAPVLWRIARVYVLMSEVADDTAAGRQLDSAIAYAKAAVRADTTDAGGYTWLAAGLGYRALTADMSDRLLLSVALLAALDRALELDPGNDVALSIKGSFYRALGNVGWIQRRIGEILFGDIPDGGHAEAEEALARAVAIAPDVMRHRYELAVLYLDMGRDEEAKRELLAASTLPIRIASDRPRLLKIAEILQERFAVSVATARTAGGPGGDR